MQQRSETQVKNRLPPTAANYPNSDTEKRQSEYLLLDGRKNALVPRSFEGPEKRSTRSVRRKRGTTHPASQIGVNDENYISCHTETSRARSKQHNIPHRKCGETGWTGEYHARRDVHRHNFKHHPTLQPPHADRFHEPFCIK